MQERPKFHRHVAGPQFFKNKTPYHYFRLGVGESQDRPFKLLVPITMDTFGDFALILSHVLQQAVRFKYSLATFVFNDNAPYKRSLLLLYPLPFQALCCVTKSDLDKYHNLLNFAPSHKQEIDGEVIFRPPPKVIADTRWQDMVFPWEHATPVFNPDRPRVPLRVPPNAVAELHRQLVKLGLDENRWYCCMHYREPNYLWKNVKNIRDCDPKVYLPLIDYVIDHLGGQVVRIGHPEMQDHAPRPGFVDLAKIENSTLLQAYATSRSRFSVMGPGGGTCLAVVFKTPLALTDAGGWFDGIGEDHFLHTYTVVTPEGTELRQEDLFESGLMNQRALEIEMSRRPGYRIIKNTTNQICRVADFMYEYTSGVEGWRPPSQAPDIVPDYTFSWSARGSIGPNFIDL